MDDLAFLEFEADLSSAGVIAAYDELPLWSAMSGLLMLEHVPLAGIDRANVVRECRRVARHGATIALATNVQGHMREFYQVFDEVLADDDSRERLREHIGRRATVAGVCELLDGGGFEATRVIEGQAVMCFATGTALLNHHFIKLGFLEGWKRSVPGCERDVFARLRDRLDALGELRLTIPIAYFEGRTR